MSEVMSKNVAKLIAILATFSRTGHNWAALDFSGNADLPGRIGTGHYQPDGTFTDWQSGGSRVRVPSPPPESPGRRHNRSELVAYWSSVTTNLTTYGQSAGGSWVYCRPAAR